MRHFLLLFLPFILLRSSNLKAQNLIVNPGFEAGELPPWTVWHPSGGGTPVVVNEEPYSGSYAVKLSGGQSSIEQIVTGLKPWTRYTLTAYIKVKSPGSLVKLGAKNYASTQSTTVSITDTTYQPYHLSFVTGGANTKATIYFIVSDTSIAYGDDFFLENTSPSGRTTYFVDDVNGADSNSGLSPSTAWKSLSKVNATVFYPGDSLLFKKGGYWSGTLHPQGEGKAGAPIVVSRYGSGDLYPVFNGNGALRTVYISNQQYFEIMNLEVTNPVNSGTTKRGIEVENTDRGVLTHIKVMNNYVHDVYGDNVKGQNGSIGIMAVVRKKSYSQVPSWFDSLNIENNEVKKVNRTAIGTSSDWRCNPVWGCNSGTGYYPTTHLVIRNNYVEDAGGDGIVPIVADGALVEYNIVNGANINSGTANAGIWCFDCNNTVFQFNEAYNVKTAIDGEGYDVDFGQDSTLFQYNYSHDNEGGFMLLCTNVEGANTNAVVRYNISQNDQYRILILNGNVQNARIYNNTMYLPEGSTTRPIVIDNWGGTFPHNVYIQNNIFYLGSAGNWQDWDSITGDKVFDYNIVYGAHTAGEPSGMHNQTADPLLGAPGTGTTGIRTDSGNQFGNVDGYKLTGSSPAIGAGLLMADNGGRDYWGNPVSGSQPPDIGAFSSNDLFELGQLQLNRTGKTAVLEWTSREDKSIDKYVVEEIKNEKPSLRQYGILARGYKNNLYRLAVHPDAIGRTSYQLTAYDLSGRKRQVRFAEAPASMKLKLWPNPAKRGSALSLQIQSLNWEGLALVTLNSINGGLLLQQRQMIHKGMNKFSVLLPSQLKAGLYTVRLSDDNHQAISSFLIQ